MDKTKTIGLILTVFGFLASLGAGLCNQKTQEKLISEKVAKALSEATKQEG